jgi:hypothetical protein
MSRPLGEERKAIRQAAIELQAECSAATWRELAARAGVGFKVARQTVDNMARAGELEAVGSAKRAHSKRWMTLFAPTEPVAVAAAPAAPLAPLDSVLRSWSR